MDPCCRPAVWSRLENSSKRLLRRIRLANCFSMRAGHCIQSLRILTHSVFTFNQVFTLGLCVPILSYAQSSNEALHSSVTLRQSSKSTVSGSVSTSPISLMAPKAKSLLFPTRFREWLAALSLLVVAALGSGPRMMAQDLTHLSGGQDTWAFAGRQLAIPANLADRARFCITINQNGIYVSSGEWILNPATWADLPPPTLWKPTIQEPTIPRPPSQIPSPSDSQRKAIGGTHGNQNCIEQYDLNGTFVRSWETVTSSEGSYLSGLASDPDGNVYAFDGFLGTVSKFTSTGTVSESWGGTGIVYGQFGYSGPSWSSWPANLIAVDSKKNVYVADLGNQRIQAFDSNGNFLRTFGSQGTSVEQFHTAPMAISVSSDDKLLVYETFTTTVNNISSSNHSLLRFDSDGSFLGRVSVPQYWPYATHVLARRQSGGPSLTYSVTPEGQLIIGDNGFGIFGYDSKTLTRMFNAQERKTAGLTSDVSNVGSAACDAQGNLWMIQPDGVKCLERQMRFDVHKPSKAVPLPSVLNVSQTSGSKVVDIDFNVLDSDSPTADIGLVALVGGTRSWSSLVVPKKFSAMTPASGSLSFSGTLRSGTLASGSLAGSVSTGKPYRVSWNAAADMPGTNFASLSFGIIARDGRPEIGVHYVTIPAESGAAAFKISSKPVQEKDLSDLWMWLVARGDSRVAVSGNKVVLTAAGQSYISGAPLPNATPTPSSFRYRINGETTVGTPFITGAPLPNATPTPSSFRYDINGETTVGTPFITGVAHDGTSTTVQGRAFAYKLINCRPVSAAEKARAQAGRFNLTSVNDNSVVSLVP